METSGKRWMNKPRNVHYAHTQCGAAYHLIWSEETEFSGSLGRATL